MVKVRFSKGLMRMEMEGHAGAERVNGIDEVCAAASILAQTLGQTGAACIDRGEAASMEYSFEHGHALVDILPVDGMREIIADKVQVILTGFALLAEYRPECLQLVCE